MKEIKLNPKELTLLADLRSQVEQAQGEIHRKEAAFVGFIYGICAAKLMIADDYDLSRIQIKNGSLLLMPKSEKPGSPPIIKDQVKQVPVKATKVN